MRFPLVVAGGGVRGRARWRGPGLVGAGGCLRVVSCCSGPGGGGVEMALWGRRLCQFGVWVSRRPSWVVCVCVSRVKRPPAGRGVKVGDGCLGFRVGLQFVGSGQLLVRDAGRHGLQQGKQSVAVGYSLLALVLLVYPRGPPRIYGGRWWLKCRGPVQRGQQVVLDRVMVVVRVCRLRVAP